jgi:hypothetical protein
VVIIRYLSAGVTDGTGGTITHVGGYTIHTFTSSGTFTVPVPASSDTPLSPYKHPKQDSSPFVTPRWHSFLLLLAPVKAHALSADEQHRIPVLRLRQATEFTVRTRGTVTATPTPVVRVRTPSPTETVTPVVTPTASPTARVR